VPAGWVQLLGAAGGFRCVPLASAVLIIEGMLVPIRVLTATSCLRYPFYG
jgi:hypothetical protein